MEINRNTIIKNLVKKHPETLSVFRKYNLVVAGGVRGPNEPLAFFAKAHEVDYDEIVKELKEAILAYDPPDEPEIDLGLPKLTKNQPNEDGQQQCRGKPTKGCWLPWPS